MGRELFTWKEARDAAGRATPEADDGSDAAESSDDEVVDKRDEEEVEEEKEDGPSAPMEMLPLYPVGG